ncbi:hypothetical protein ACVIGB_000938 [Bradyrhizobium sp. USDA 4341]
MHPAIELANRKIDTTTEEARTQHADSLKRLERTSKKLHGHFVGAIREGARDDAGVGQIAGLVAMFWRFHAESMNYLSPATLLKGAAIMDGIEERYRADQRFKINFDFKLNPRGADRESDYSPNVLRFLAHAFQGPFANRYGVLRDDIDRKAFDHLRETMSQPLPIEFFIEIGLDTTMRGLALWLYDEYRGVDPVPRAEKRLRTYGDKFMQEGTEKIERALALLPSKPTPEVSRL